MQVRHTMKKDNFGGEETHTFEIQRNDGWEVREKVYSPEEAVFYLTSTETGLGFDKATAQKVARFDHQWKITPEDANA